MKNCEKFNRENVLDLSNNAVDVTGLRFGYLQALRQTRKDDEGQYLWLCLCECLRTCERTIANLNSRYLDPCVCKDGSIKCPEPPYDIPERKAVKPMWMTQGQLNLLMLIAPGPVGGGMTVSAAAKRLKITPNAAFKKLRKFKTRFPTAWKRFIEMRRTMSRHREAMKKNPPAGTRGMGSLDALMNSYGMSVVDSMIKRKF